MPLNLGSELRSTTMGTLLRTAGQCASVDKTETLGLLMMPCHHEGSSPCGRSCILLKCRHKLAKLHERLSMQQDAASWPPGAGGQQRGSPAAAPQRRQPQTAASAGTDSGAEGAAGAG